MEFSHVNEHIEYLIRIEVYRPTRDFPYKVVDLLVISAICLVIKSKAIKHLSSQNQVSISNAL
jgi:hypothetical protein